MTQVLNLFYNPTVLWSSVDNSLQSIFFLLSRLGISFCSRCSILPFTEPLYQLLYFSGLYIFYLFAKIFYFFHVSCLSTVFIEVTGSLLMSANIQMWITRFCQMFSSSFGDLWKQLVHLENHILVFSQNNPLKLSMQKWCFVKKSCYHSE